MSLKIIFLGKGDLALEIREWYRARPMAGTKFYAFIENAEINNWIPKEDELFVIAIADTEVKAKIVRSLKERGAKFASIIHPTALIAEDADLGEGIVIGPYSVVSVGAHVGAFTYINMHSSIGHGVTIFPFCSISSHVDLCGNVRLEECVFIGSSVAILPGVIISDSAFIGAGSVVTNNISRGDHVFGNPARGV